MNYLILSALFVFAAVILACIVAAILLKRVDHHPHRNCKPWLQCLLFSLCLLAFMPAEAQTNTLPSLFGNLPPYQTNTTLFTQGKLEFRVAAITGNSYEAINSLTWFVTPALGITGDCYNGGVNNLDSVHLGLEYGYAVSGVRFTLRGVAGGTLITHRPEGVLSIFASYVPASSTAPNFFMFGGPAIRIDRDTFKSDGVGIVNLMAGFGYRF